MNPLDFLLKWIPPTWLLAATAVFAALAGIFFWLYQGKVNDYAQLQAQVSMERQQAKDDAERAKERAERVTADVSLAWSRSLEHLRANPRIRVLPAADCHLPDGNAGTTGESSFPGLKPAPSTTRSLTCEECEQVANDAVSDAAQLMHLIDWVQRQRRVEE